MASRRRQVLDLDDLQRGTVGAAADRALLGNAARLGDGRIARQVLEDLIHLVLDEVAGRGEASANALVVRRARSTSAALSSVAFSRSSRPMRPSSCDSVTPASEFPRAESPRPATRALRCIHL